MHMQLKALTAGAAVLLALASPALAASAHVVNNCGIPVYYAAVPANGNAAMQLMPAGGISEAYGANGIGISIKLSTSMNGPVTQLEFTPSSGRINYDMSNINGNPFAAGGMTLAPSVAASTSFPTCVPVVCAAGVSTCAAAYNEPNDTATLVCSGTADLTLTLCTAGHNKREEAPAHAHRLHARHLPKLA